MTTNAVVDVHGCTTETCKTKSAETRSGTNIKVLFEWRWRTLRKDHTGYYITVDGLKYNVKLEGGDNETTGQRRSTAQASNARSH